MSKELYSVIHQSTLNKIILDKIHEFNPKVGNPADGSQLQPSIVEFMNEVAAEIAATVDELNKIFIEKNLTAVSARDYCDFLCSLLPEYIFAPTSTVTREEAEAAIILQVAETSIESMREQIAVHNFNAQTGEEIMGIDLIRQQVNEIDDGTLRDAYKTLLTNQLNLQVLKQQ